MSDAQDRTERRKEQLPHNATDWQVKPRRPSSWLSESELRCRARQRKMIYCAIAVICMLVFVVLIYLLLERTRWSAGSSGQTSLVGVTSQGAHRAG